MTAIASSPASELRVGDVVAARAPQRREWTPVATGQALLDLVAKGAPSAA